VARDRNLVARSTRGIANTVDSSRSKYGVAGISVRSVVLQTRSTWATLVRCRRSPVLCENHLLERNAFRSPIAHYKLKIGVQARVFRRACEHNVLPYRGKACGGNNKQRWVFHSAGKLSLSGRLPFHPSFQASGPLELRNTIRTIASASDLRHRIPARKLGADPEQPCNFCRLPWVPVALVSP
jgi:hypothetical protein